MHNTAERQSLKERAVMVWVRSGMLATGLTIVATGLLLLR